MSDRRALSLGPALGEARSVEALVTSLTPHGDADLARGLTRVRDAFAIDFPENVFLDLDLLAASLAGAPPAERASRVTRIVELSRAFSAPPICFRYAHDFLYGFDWYRWVACAPAERSAVGPFDPAFLDYLLARGSELRALIAAGDAKYGPIDAGAFRNPFPFSRSPADEVRLHRALAERDLVPVEAWSTTGRARYDRRFSEERKAVARELGIATGDGAREPP